MHDATCGDCGKQCQVPFEPRQDKPVYCNECFPKHKPESSRRLKWWKIWRQRRIWRTEADLAEEAALTEDHEKCTKRLVEIVVKIVKFHSNQNRTSQSTAVNAFKVIKEIKDNYHFMFLLDHE